MKRLIAVATLMVFGVPVAQAAERTAKFNVEKMYCEACPLTVSKAMRGVKGVTSVKVEYETKTAVVVFDDAATTVEAIAAASSNAGYPARLAAN